MDALADEIDHLVRALTEHDPSTPEEVFFEQSRAAWHRLREIGSPAVPRLLAALADPDGGQRGIVAQLLGRMRDPSAVAPLIHLLNEDLDTDVQWQAAVGLGELGDPRAVPPLVVALNNAEDLVRGTAAAALGAFPPDLAVAPLVAALRDGDWEVRAAAAMSLGRIGEARAVPALIDRLDDASPDVRAAIAQALAEIGDPRALPTLRQMQKYDSEHTYEEGTLSEIAARCIARIEGRQAG